ncbi:hypothetical protein [Ligilactobacillus ruminis]|uniref:hypothetical protein n=1 Tax=Ligilactobacillus ruminis TaxID=1623 RepID=UPI00189AB3CC|nr:hypothetical protein [Ligilactobacillus ruminis]
MAETEAQKKATKKWNDANKAHRNYLSSRGAARSFIRNKATEDDLLELRKMIDDKLNKME